MAQAAVILPLLSGAMSIYSGMQQKKSADAAADEQRRMGEKNAANIESETLEQKRRADQSADEQMAQSRAKAGASGVKTAGSSFDIFMGGEEDKYQSNIDWLLKSGQSQAELARGSASSSARTTESQGEAALYGGIGDSFSSLGTGYSAGKTKGWWG